MILIFIRFSSSFRVKRCFAMPKNNDVKGIVRKIIKDYILNNHVIICNTEIPDDKSGNAVEKFAEMINLSENLMKLTPGESEHDKEIYEKTLKRIKAIWYELKDYFPVFDEEELKEIISSRARVFKVERCIDVARILCIREKPMRFTEIKDEAMELESFRASSMSINKLLSRTLRYLSKANLVIKVGRKTIKGNVVDTYYFRLFSMKVLGRTCRNCKFIKSVEWIRDKMDELIAQAKKD